jgi:type III secretion protein V
MAAGLIVTRTSDESDKHLGDSIRKQVAAKPRVLVVAGGICLLMAFVPGFPSTIFALLALVVTAFGALLTPSCRERLHTLRNPRIRAVVRRLDSSREVIATAPAPQRPVTALLLRVPAALLSGEHASKLTAGIEHMLHDFQLTLGLTLPRLHLHGEPDASGWELLAYEVPIARGATAHIAVAELTESVRHAIRRSAPLFVGAQDTAALLTGAAADVPDVVHAVQHALPLHCVSETLRRLVAESVSIRNLRHIFEALADAGQRSKDVATLTEICRIALSRQISHQVAPEGHLRAVALQPQLENLLRQSLRTDAGPPELALDPEHAQAICVEITRSVAEHRPAAVLAPVDLRWHVRRLIEAECFETPVLSFHELVPTLQLTVLHRIPAPRACMQEAA